MFSRKKRFPEDHFLFEKLPPEIRNKIYRYVLTSKDSHFSMELRSGDNRLCYGLRHRGLPNTIFSLLFVNRAIHYEARSILYGENTFSFDLRRPTNGDHYLHRDISYIRDFFLEINGAAQYVRKIHFACEAKSLENPVLRALCSYIDSTLQYTHVSLEIDLYRIFNPFRRGKNPISYEAINTAMKRSSSAFLKTPGAQFFCTTRPWLDRGWTTALDTESLQQLDADFREYVERRGSFMLQ